MKQIVSVFLLFFSSFAYSTSYHSPTKFVYNLSQDTIILDCDSTTIRPIASVTKLMTALVIMDEYKDLTERITYKKYIKRNASREELLTMLLVKSDNTAAEILAKNYPGGRDKFIQEMNIKAASLGMSNTHYDDPSGLSAGNISTARDLTRLLSHIYTYPKLRDITSTTSYNLEIESKKKRSNYITVNNTNRNLLLEFREIEISKTGTTSAAGKCLAMFVTRNGQHYVIVILGEKNRKHIENVSKNILISL